MSQATRNDVPSPRKSFKYALFDLTVVAAVCVAVYLGGHDCDTAFLPAPEHIVINATETGDNATYAADAKINRQVQAFVRQLEAEVGEERRRLRDDLVARAADATRSDAPLVDEEDTVRNLAEADTLLLQIKVTGIILEAERQSWPLFLALRELSAELDDAESVPVGAWSVYRFLDRHAAILDAFRDTVGHFRALDVRLRGRGGDVEENYRKMMDGYEELHEQLEDLRSRGEETAPMERQLRDQLITLTNES